MGHPENANGGVVTGAATSLPEMDILWFTAGLGCDGGPLGRCGLQSFRLLTLIAKA